MTPPEPRTLVSLFTGAGGLDVGLEAAGFRPVLCVESDRECRLTIEENRSEWPVHEDGNVLKLDVDEVAAELKDEHGEIDLLAGGPPCQPFSKSGYWVNGASARLTDPRAKTLDAYFDLLAAIRPRTFLLENVSGFASHGKEGGLEHILRLTRKINRKTGCRYRPRVLDLNAADFGVPQRRRRLFVVASRSGETLKPPACTHMVSTSGGVRPYVTAWDAIGDLDGTQWPEELQATGYWADLLPSIPEGSNYLWLTDRGGGEPLFGWRTRYWSFLLKLAKCLPSWTLQADPGPATGPFHWRSRQLSIRELARLQTFPDTYAFGSCRRIAVRQIGNAVPPLLAEVIGRALQAQVFAHPWDDEPTLAMPSRQDCPEPERVSEVPAKYNALSGEHAAHPGAGKGPRASRSVAAQDKAESRDNKESI